MSGPTVELVHDAKWGWMLINGNETFYDEHRYLRTWETPEAAVQWLADNHPELILHRPHGLQYTIDVKS